ncbi:Alpha/beta hydrolase family protein [Pelomyxa schiedti]|nr:Alpha/beta hydrolase family protein [Pelomyxa schiedti]
MAATVSSTDSLGEQEPELVVDREECSHLFFFPTNPPLRDPPSPHATLACIPGSEEGITLRCQLVVPESCNGHTVIYFHGNGEVATNYSHDPDPRCIREFFLSLGLRIIFYEYRAYGGSTGRDKLFITKTLEDVSTIISSFSLIENKVFVFGRSLGSLFAIRMASKYPALAGVILESGVGDVASVWGKTFVKRGIDLDKLADEQRKYIRQQDIAGFPGPVLIMHTKNDKIAPFSQAELFSQWRQDNPKTTLVAFPSGGHNGIYESNRPQYKEALRKFFTENST